MYLLADTRAEGDNRQISGRISQPHSALVHPGMTTIKYDFRALCLSTGDDMKLLTTYLATAVFGMTFSSGNAGDLDTLIQD